jgi:hypothetical protein
MQRVERGYVRFTDNTAKAYQIFGPRQEREASSSPICPVPVPERMGNALTLMVRFLTVRHSPKTSPVSSSCLSILSIALKTGLKIVSTDQLATNNYCQSHCPGSRGPKAGSGVSSL